VLCDMPTDRPNISLFTVPIPKGQVDKRKPLLGLIPPEAAAWDCSRFDDESWSPFMIPKTLIFIDDRTLCCTLTTELIKRFPQHLANEAQVVVSEYHSSLSAKALERNLQALREGVCRIMVSTEAVGMGLDVSDIERIVQWRVPPWLTVSGWWQRAGRAARDPSIDGVATIYYDPALQVGLDSPFCGRPDVEEELELVYTACKAAATSVDHDEDTDTLPGMRRPKGTLPCEGQLIWYLNTRGCIRDVAMHYLGSKSSVRPDFNSEDMGTPCCCRCFKSSAISPELFEGFEVCTCTPFVRGDEGIRVEAVDTEPNPENILPDSQKTTHSAQSSTRIRLALHHALDIWRHQILSKHARADHMLRPKHILTDAVMAKLEKHCFSIQNAADIAPAVSPPGRDVLKHTRVAAHTSELAERILHVVTTATNPEPAPRKNGKPWTAPDAKPLYSALDIENAKNKTISQMMVTANSILRRFDLTSVNAKEATRQKRLKNGSQVHRTTQAASQVSSIADTDSVARSAAASETASMATWRTDRERMPPPALPLKRPRGRPRGSKNRVKTEGSVSSGVSSLASAISESVPLAPTAHGDDPVGGVSRQPPKKRRRGVPDSPDSKTELPSYQIAGYKVHSLKKPPFKSEASSEALVPAATHSKAPSEPPRRRGRPPGSKKKPAEVSSAGPGDQVLPSEPTPITPEASAAVLVSLAAGAEAPPEPPRRRGRPPGSKNKPKPKDIPSTSCV
jgi:hypothetical protein